MKILVVCLALVAGFAGCAKEAEPPAPAATLYYEAPVILIRAKARQCAPELPRLATAAKASAPKCGPFEGS
jgi:hypothetical protein